MAKGIPATKEQKLKALEMLKRGIPQNRIAKELGFTKAAISLWAKKFNIKTNRFKHQHKDIIISLLVGGKQKKEIIKEFNIHMYTLNRWIKESGIILPKHEFYSNKLKENIIFLLNSGQHTRFSLSKEYNLNYKTLCKWINIWKKDTEINFVLDVK